MLIYLIGFIIVIVLVFGYNTWHFARGFKTEVTKNIVTTATLPVELLTENDIQHLPSPVKKYLEYAGVVGKPKVNSFKVEFKGKIRQDENSPWMPFTSVQYNFMDTPTRLFYMDATMMRLPVAGFHSYHNGDAFMDIRLLSSFKVAYQDGEVMGIGETVTFFNDMCCMAPATLIDKRIEWLKADGNKVLASFSTNGITIHAWLYFNNEGQLINFTSEDRCALQKDGSMRKLPWSTPLKNYRSFDGLKVAGYGDAIYKYPEGDLCYGMFETVNVEYNPKQRE